MKRAALVATVLLALRTAAPAETPAKEKPSCPKTGGVEIGQKRPEAFKMMAHDVTNEKVFHHVPKDRDYVIDVTFSSDKPTAEIVGLHYIFKPPQGLLDGIIQRYGEPSETLPEPGAAVWRIPACHVQLRYKMQEIPGTPPKPLQEEMWLEPLAPAKAKPKGK